ncbi:unnamed protein product [Aspergillus oryzae]|uniref:Unnamed protein product n=2 Tax=Aspergillus oryzae TaxID=5062 RepID=A0AAN4YYC1_ASPOZ|nr:unnamed protein product [Aspergillus oryzae]GMF85316.1 unnamed protein product [Aspergillus oryzae]GMG04331.1 unnamed protein product [Aspergillus oryzae]GMG36080.1 unnamed protein product [Aspergillus oryzae]GMG42902.1 unnamed protein product [Aspergillus oryzae var. brunneus]
MQRNVCWCHAKRGVPSRSHDSADTLVKVLYKTCPDAKQDVAGGFQRAQPPVLLISVREVRRCLFQTFWLQARALDRAHPGLAYSVPELEIRRADLPNFSDIPADRLWGGFWHSTASQPQIH